MGRVAPSQLAPAAPLERLGGGRGRTVTLKMAQGLSHLRAAIFVAALL